MITLPLIVAMRAAANKGRPKGRAVEERIFPPLDLLSIAERALGSIENRLTHGASAPCFDPRAQALDLG